MSRVKDPDGMKYLEFANALRIKTDSDCAFLLVVSGFKGYGVCESSRESVALEARRNLATALRDVANSLTKTGPVSLTTTESPTNHAAVLRSTLDAAFTLVILISNQNRRAEWSMQGALWTTRWLSREAAPDLLARANDIDAYLAAHPEENE